MNFILLLFLVLTQQSTASGAGESFSKLVQLYQYAETQLNEVKTMFATVMENAALQQKKFSNDLRRETSAYVDEELKKFSASVDDSDTLKSAIANCVEEVDNVIEVAITRFVNILDTAERIVYESEDKLQNEPNSNDIDEINDEVDDILDECKENFEITIVPQVEDLLRQLKKKLVSLQPDLRRCFDEALY